MTEGGSTPQIPKHRLDEESTKRKDAEAKLAEATERIEALEKSQAEKDSNYQQLYEAEQKKVQRLQTKLNEQESHTERAQSDLMEWRRRATFLGAARDHIRGDALEDAFDLIPEAEMQSLQPEDVKGFAKAAQKLVDAKPYLANGKGGAGSGGSGSPIVGEDPQKPKALPFNKHQKRRIS